MQFLIEDWIEFCEINWMKLVNNLLKYLGKVDERICKWNEMEQGKKTNNFE